MLSITDAKNGLLKFGNGVQSKVLSYRDMQTYRYIIQHTRISFITRVPYSNFEAIAEDSLKTIDPLQLFEVRGRKKSDSLTRTRKFYFLGKNTCNMGIKIFWSKAEKIKFDPYWPLS